MILLAKQTQSKGRHKFLRRIGKFAQPLGRTDSSGRDLGFAPIRRVSSDNPLMRWRRYAG
jgi:hypothetical protein